MALKPQKELFDNETIWPQSGSDTKFYKDDRVFKTHDGNGTLVWLQDTVDQVIKDSGITGKMTGGG